MAVYAIGDVQGCLDPLQRLLKQVRFDPTHDKAWFTGDLVNRGPDSAGVLRLIKSLGESAVAVLGNHDLHLLAVAVGVEGKKERDTLDDLLSAPDREPLLAWLRHRPLLHYDSSLGYAMVHAGFLPQWSLAQALVHAREIETQVAANKKDFFQKLYGNSPAQWDESLHGPERARVVVNAFTRLRYCDRNGNMDLQQKGAPGSQPPHLFPWFQVPGRHSQNQRIVFGHWSALGLHRADNVIGLDSGCAWGRMLTAARLDVDPPEIHTVTCSGMARP